MTEKIETTTISEMKLQKGTETSIQMWICTVHQSITC